MTAPIFDLQPMSIGDILDRTVRFYRRYLLHTLGIVSLPYLLIVPIGIWLGSAMRFRGGLQALRNPGVIAGVVLLVLAFFWLNFVSMGALAWSVSERYLGGTPTIWSSYAPVVRRSAALIWAYFLAFLIWGGVAALGVALPVVVSTILAVRNPGSWGVHVYVIFALSFIAAAVMFVVIFFRLLLVTQVIVIEDIRGPAALQRSWALMGKNVGRAGLILAFAAALGAILSMLFRFPTSILAGSLPAPTAAILNVVLGHLAQIASVPFGTIARTLLYYDSRIRQEAFDLEMMAQNLGAAGKLGSPEVAAPAPSGAPEPPAPGATTVRAAPAPASGPAPAARPARSPGSPASPRPSGGAFKVCPQCGAQVPNVRPTCPSCGTRVPFRPAVQ